MRISLFGLNGVCSLESQKEILLENNFGNAAIKNLEFIGKNFIFDKPTNALVAFTTLDDFLLSSTDFQADELFTFYFTSFVHLFEKQKKTITIENPFSLAFFASPLSKISSLTSAKLLFAERCFEYFVKKDSRFVFIFIYFSLSLSSFIDEHFEKNSLKLSQEKFLALKKILSEMIQILQNAQTITTRRIVSKSFSEISNEFFGNFDCEGCCFLIYIFIFI